MNGCSIEDPIKLNLVGEVAGISPSIKNKDTFLVSISYVGISYYNINTLKCVLTHTLSPNQRISHRAIELEMSRDVYFVEGDYCLVMIRHLGKSSEKATTTRYDKKIKALLETRQSSSNLVLVFDDGAICIPGNNNDNSMEDSEVAQFISFPKNQGNLSRHAVIHAFVSEVTNNDLNKEESLVYVVRQDLDTFGILLQCYKVNAIKVEACYTQKLEFNTNGLIGASNVSFDSESKKLMFLMEDGSLSTFDLFITQAEINDWCVANNGPTIHPVLVSNLVLDSCQSANNSINDMGNSYNSTRTAIKTFGSEYLAICNHSDVYTLNVWDTVFGTLQGSHSIGYKKINNESGVGRPLVNGKSGNLTSKDTLQVLQIESDDKTFLVSLFDKCVLVWPYFVSELTTAAIIGKATSTDKYISKERSEGNFASIVPTPLDFGSFFDNSKSVAQSRKATAEQECIPQLQEAANACDSARFSRLFREYTHFLLTTTNNTIGGVVTKHLLSQSFVNRVLGLIVASHPALNTEVVVSELLATGLVSHESCPQLFGYLVSKDMLECIDNFFQHVRDPSEDVLVRAIKYTLNADKGPLIMRFLKVQLPNLSINSLDAEKSATSQALFLYRIFSATRNDVKLRTHLQTLTSNEVHTILKTLITISLELIYPSNNIDNQILHLAAAYMNFTAVNAVDWLCLIIDVHLTTILLFPDNADLLVFLNSNIGTSMDILADRQNLLAYLKYFISTTSSIATARKRPAPLEYSISMLVI